MENKRTNCLKSYVTAEEHAKIQRLAKQTGLSVSDYIRRIITGQRIESRLDQEAFLSALKVNADLGRLGGLFKYYLAQRFENVPPEEIRKVLHDIEDRQRQLRPVISKIRDIM
ncbi:plasmid mobilization protein [Desulfobacter sp.]|uniref:plasmid mobilization protein n=1 Tax=Desulfobacter sp. TaxID=2294 RepID=UPI003D11BCF2